MYSAEVLSQLRSLNHLTQEMRHIPSDSVEAIFLRKEITALRGRLPNAILGYHDRFESRSKPSATKVERSNCSACHTKLPRRLLSDLSVPGRFGICPKCGVFLWMEPMVRAAADESLQEVSAQEKERI